uniref:Uncharacterized protein n=1 Tax=Rhizophora mucronata TaxID=61149 RepID=A0A2P2KWD1_RHIMU
MNSRLRVRFSDGSPREILLIFFSPLLLFLVFAGNSTCSSSKLFMFVSPLIYKISSWVFLVDNCYYKMV